MFRNILVTGGCGFIGSEFVRQQMGRPDLERLVNVDILTYAGNPDNLLPIAGDKRYQHVRADIADRGAMKEIFTSHPFDCVVHFAAESHVDRSLEDASPFIHTNVQGTLVLLEAARAHQTKKFVHVSTDEVYGSLGATGLFTEETPLAPNSPYSASKASSDLLVRAYFHSYKLPVVTTRCSNNYGPYQFPEKVIPLFVTRLLRGEKVPVYGTGTNVRDWIHVSDHVRGVTAALEHGVPGEVYNFGGRTELTNLELTHRLLQETGRGTDSIEYVTDRLGHDLRYAIDCTKAERELGWLPQVPFERGLRETVAWYRDHADWVERIRSGAYRN